MPLPSPHSTPTSPLLATLKNTNTPNTSTLTDYQHGSTGSTTWQSLCSPLQSKYPPNANDYHWALYLHENPMTGGTKYHIKTVGLGWIPDHGITVAIVKQFLLVGLYRIADV